MSRESMKAHGRSLYQKPCLLEGKAFQMPPFPFHTELCFKKLLETLKSPEFEGLNTSICPSEAVEKVRNGQDLNNKTMRWLLTPWMPFSESKNQWMAVSKPFSFDFVVAQNGFVERFLDEEGQFKGQSYITPENLLKAGVLKGIEVILNQIYQKEVQFDPTPIFSTEDDDGLRRFYEFQFDNRFIEVACKGECPLISEQDMEKLASASEQPIEQWLPLFPIDAFTFKGFTFITAKESTHKESLSAFQRELHEGTIVEEERLNKLQTYLRIMTRSDSLKMRIYSYMDEKLRLLQPTQANHQGCMLSNSFSINKDKFEGTEYQAFISNPQKSHYIKSEMKPSWFKDRIEHEHVVLIPLIPEGELLGIVELEVIDKKVLNHLDPFTLSEILHSLEEAIAKSLETLEQRTQMIIQQHCTALHPAVKWRFDEEGRKYLENANSANFDNIIFNNVYPLFSESDIQSSSMFRNEAIQADLLEQLHKAQNVLLAMQEAQNMPILGETLYLLETHKDRLSDGLQTSDELLVQNFLKNKIETLFKELKIQSPKVDENLNEYYQRLNKKYGMIHTHRDRYEKTVNLLNSTIAQMIDQEQAEAQKIIPHYSEKTLTDGVELSLYLGETLLKEHEWSNLHLHNLRLWQLMLTCKIARKCEEILPSMDLPLRMTHLVLVQDMPMTIRFSTEEKEFIVDGSYNIRYEIMKKRIDKATVAGRSGERLTQAGQIAIVYSHTSEAELYQGFFQYLITLGLIEDQVEQLELDELQSVQGLKALRITVKPERREKEREPEPLIASRIQG